MAELARPRTGGRVPDDDLPYAGEVGRTRSEVLQVLMPDGSLKPLAVYTGIDAVADPALAALARAGTLHHVADGVELALAFTYHDPLVRAFLLVVPEGLRHRALALRAEVMLEIARDGRHAVPDYVRDVELVVGHRGLSRRLAGADPAASEEPARARSLAERELELTRRERLIDARERALSARALLHAVRDSDIQEIDESVDESPYRAVVVADSERPDGATAGLEEVELVETIDAGEAALEGEDEGPYEAPVVVDLEEPRIAPPAAFALDPALQLCLMEQQGKAWLFVRGRPVTRQGDGELELLVQLEPGLAPPVVLISLVFDVARSPDVRRGVVDPFAPEQTRALYLLAQHFEVELVALTSRGLERFATLHTPRERNVRAILAQLERHGAIDRTSWLEARDARLASPPPWRDLGHPFQSPGGCEPPRTATEAAVLLDELAEWLSPERKERLRLALSVPDDTIDACYRSGIAHGLDWGLSLSPALAARALELGLGAGESDLLERRIEGLCRTSREPDLGGLEEAVLRAEWSEALEHAARLGVSLSDEARELALAHAGERALVHAKALSESRDAALDPVRARALASPPDLAALDELLARGGYRDVQAGCRLAHKLPPEVGGKLFAEVARRDDPVALDALLSLLGDGEPLVVRAGAALALAFRRALPALDELVAHVRREAAPEYAIFAQALGRYGAGSFRAIAAALQRQSVPPERVALVYAQLSLHGARAQVRAKARSREPRDARLADSALALASELKDGKKPAAGLEQQASLTVFCETFDRLCRDTVG